MIVARTPDLLMHRSAVISDDRLYRYRLERDLRRNGKVAAFIMVNSSTADDETDDHTIRKLYGFSERLGFSRFIVGNKFAFRTKDMRELNRAHDPIGPLNDEHLERIMRDAQVHIVAWGPLSKLAPALRSRWKRVAEIAQAVGCQLYCLSTAADGHPRHPLMLAYDTPLTPWNASCP